MYSSTESFCNTRLFFRPCFLSGELPGLLFASKDVFDFIFGKAGDLPPFVAVSIT